MKNIKLIVIVLLSVFLLSCDKTTITNNNTTTYETSATETTVSRELCSFYRAPEIEIVNPVITSTTFSFDYVITEAGCNGYILAMYLNNSGSSNTIYTLTDYNDTFITDLEARSRYTLKIEYMFDQSDGTQLKYAKLYTFNTEPDIEINAENLTSTFNSISFDLATVDPDSALNITNIEVIVPGEFYGNIPFEGPFTLSGLVADTTYTIEVDYNYRYQNIDDRYSDTLVFTITTETLPEVNFTTEEYIITDDRIVLDIICSNPQVQFDYTNYKLFKNGTLIREEESTTKLIDIMDLDPSTVYRIEANINYSFDNFSSESVYNKTLVVYEKTDEQDTVSIRNILISSSSITFDIELYYQTGEGIITTIELRDANTDEVLASLPTDSLVNLSFSNLNPETDYALYIEYENNTIDILPAVSSASIWRMFTTESAE